MSSASSLFPALSPTVSLAMDPSRSDNARHPSPVISPLHSRSPFALAPKQSGRSRTNGSPFGSRPASSSAPSTWVRALLPRSKARCVVLLVLVSVATVIGLISFSIVNIDLPPVPLDSYSDDQPKLEDLQRSFEEPSFALLSSPQPHTIGCPQKDSPTAPLLFYGVFSAPDKVDRRALIRREIKDEWPAELVEFKFIFGRPATNELARLLADEQEEHGDIVIVRCNENIDTGKTHAFFEWVAETRTGEPPKFVM